jgi:DNA polymerase III sliding clamp (beta) subunit (PCNA family)
MSGATEKTILGISPEEFPELPVVNDVNRSPQAIRIEIDDRPDAVRSGYNRFHTGPYRLSFRIKDGEITVVSVDGYRMAMPAIKNIPSGRISLYHSGQNPFRGIQNY